MSYQKLRREGQDLEGEAIKLKIKNATTRSDGGLCHRCKHGSFIRGEAVSQEKIRCGAFETWMEFEAHSCPTFEERGSMSLWEMQQIAYRFVLDPKKKGQMGFITPRDFKDSKEFQNGERLKGPLD